MYRIGLLVVLFAVGVSGCEKEEGPAEKMGKKVDEAVENVAERVDNQGPAEKAGEQIDAATKKVQQAMQKAGQTVGDAMQEAGQKIEEKTGN